MFDPEHELLYIANHVSWLFHATIGLDPLGNFSHIENLNYEIEPFTYEEMGRNHAPHTRPFNGPGKPGRLTLRWGMIVRSRLFEWMHDVKIGRDFLKTVFIYQLSRKHLPLRVYQLSGCWPVSWTSSNLSTEEKTGMATEELVLAYDQVDMYNLSAIAMIGELVDEPLSDAIDALKPKSPSKAVRKDARAPEPWKFEGKLLDSFGTAETEDQRKARWKEMNQTWGARKRTYAAVGQRWEATEAEDAGTVGFEEGYEGFEGTAAEDERKGTVGFEEGYGGFEGTAAEEERKGTVGFEEGYEGFTASKAEEGRAASKGGDSGGGDSGDGEGGGSKDGGGGA